MNSKKKKLEELLEKNLTKTTEQVSRDDASVRTILQRFRNKTVSSDLESDPVDQSSLERADSRPEYPEYSAPKDQLIPKNDQKFDQRSDPKLDQADRRDLLDQSLDLKADPRSQRDRNFRDQISTNTINSQPSLATQNLATEQPSYNNQVLKQPSYTETRLLNNLATEQPSYLNTKLYNSQVEETSSQNKLPLNSIPTYRVANFIDDEIIPTLSLAEQSVFRRLYRLAYGFNRNTTDSVSLSKIAEKCNMSVAGVKAALKTLQTKSLVKTTGENKFDPKGGNKYEILVNLATEQPSYTEASYTEARLSNNQATQKPGYTETRLPSGSINHDHDHDDLKNTDHHQSEMMRIYQKITGNNWTKTDRAAYEKIKKIPLSIIEQAMLITAQRAATRPNSLNYFVKEILNLANPSKASKAQRKNILAKIIQRVRERSIGKEVSFSDFLEDVKREAIREGVFFDNDLFNEIVGR